MQRKRKREFMGKRIDTFRAHRAEEKLHKRRHASPSNIKNSLVCRIKHFSMQKATERTKQQVIWNTGVN